MDDLSGDDLRGLATAANLRRALGALDAAPLPSVFVSLLGRLGEREVRRPADPTGVARPRP